MSEFSEALHAATAGSEDDELIEVDFSGAKEGDYDGPVPPGEYQVTVCEVEAGTSEKGNPKVVITFRVDPDQPEAGRKVYRHCPTRGPGAGILKSTLVGLGLDASGGQIRKSSLIGRTATITVRQQKNNPEYTEVCKVVPREAPRTSLS